MFSALRASVWSKNKGGPGPPSPSPGSATELSERLEQAPVTLKKIRDCSQSRLYVLLVCAECTCTIKTPALPCTIFFYRTIFAIWPSLSGTSSRLFFSEIVSNYPISPRVFRHKITWYTWNFQNFLVFSQFLRNLTFIFSDSHEKFSLVLFQMTTLKNVKKECNVL